MGNKTSIAAIIDQPYVSTGGMISGRVYLSVPNDTLRADELHLSLVGEEYTEVILDGKRFDVQRFLDQTFPIARYNGVVPPGSYEFPFQIAIPQGLPGSMAAKGPGECTIRYYVDARLFCRGPFNSFPIYYRYPLIVQPAPVVITQPTALLGQPTVYRIRRAKCISVGAVVCGLYTPCSVLSPGQIVPVSYLIHPIGSRDGIIRAEIDIIEKVTWNTKGTIRDKEFSLGGTQLLFHQIVFSTVGNVSCRPGSQTEVDEASQQSLSQYLASMQSQVTISISAIPRFTTQGRTITVQHFLKLRLVTGIGKTNPKYYVPISLQNVVTSPQQQPVMSTAVDGTNYLGHFAPLASAPVPNALPANWHPVVATPVMISGDNVKYADQELSMNAPAISPEHVEAHIVTPARIIEQSSPQGK